MAQESSKFARASDANAWKGTARYEIVGALGEGGMGVVYEAFDRERRQLVAVKTLPRFDAAALYLFKQEFRTLADVQHANLVRLYELVIPDDGQVFFTMELVRGVDFNTYIRKQAKPRRAGAAVTARPAERATSRPRSLEAADDGGAGRATPADIDRLRPALRQLVAGVQALHGAGKLHRDIKPSNVLVTAEGRVVLLDFGVATELFDPSGEMPAGAGEMVGTARYMAPEQACNEPPTAASDWYSVGVILYEALVGRPPFMGSAVDVLTMKATMEAAAPSHCTEGVPADLDALCTALLHRDAGLRPTGAEILRRLGVTPSLPPPPLAPPNAPQTDLVGRSAQLLALRESFDVTHQGRPVAVHISGASGMGMSTMAHHFLDELARNGEALVLRGRAYERESVPYKAVDSAIDALSRHLLLLADAGEPLALPRDMWALSKLFPVLQRVPASPPPPTEGPVDDPQGVRRRAFRALGELLGSLAERQPVVVFVDDAQWGDVDSAVLFLDLLRSADAPPILLMTTCRSKETTTSPFLVELRARWPDTVLSNDVQIGPLSFDDARQLALNLLGASDDAAARTARAVAREARGSPFLIEELVRSNRTATGAEGPTLAVLTLDQMVSERLERLPPSARLLVEILAVGGRPLPSSVVAEAADAKASDDHLALGVARRFLRMGLRDGRDVVEVTHDRIRETIVAQLPEATLRAHHGRLAQVLQAAPGGDAEAVAMHWLGAGDTDRAARYAESAAEQAASMLAFDQASRLMRVALDNTAPSSPSTRHLRLRLAELLRHGGHAIESSRVFLDLAQGGSADERVEYERAAAEQLLGAGRIDEGTELLHRVLRAVGLSAPRSPVGAVFWLLVYRAWLFFLGLRIEDRRPDDVSPQARLRVEALFTTASGFAMVDVIVGACMQARHLVEALRAGNRFQLLRAVSLEAAQLAATGNAESRRELRLAAIARELAEREGTSEADAYFAGASGIALFLRGRWIEATEMLERAQRETQHALVGFSSVRMFSVYTGFLRGHIEDSRRRMDQLYAEADDRGDLYTTVSMRTSVGVHAALSLDDVESARRAPRAALAQWSQGGFHLQHWQAIAYGLDAEVYAGAAESAYERAAQVDAPLRRSFLLHTGFVRAMTFFSRGRLAIASIEGAPELRRARVAEARRMARRLQREYSAWTAGLAHMVLAAAGNAEGRRDEAIASLRAAVEANDASHSGLYAEPARYRLGQLLGGEQGRALRSKAVDAMTAQGIRNPERWVTIWLPGAWEAAP